MSIVYDTLQLANDPTPWIRVEADNKDWCVLWLQGWTSTIAGHLEDIKRMSEKSGVTFAMLNFAGHGDHPVTLEESTRAQQQNEVISAYDELKRMKYKNIIVIGGSFGGYMAALLAGKRKLTAVVLRAPGAYPDNELDLPYNQTLESVQSSGEEFLDFRRSSEFYKQSIAHKALASHEGVSYIIEHELDTIVPPAVPRSYFQVAQHSNYLVVPNTEHSPKLMSEPKKHFAYIEYLLVSIIKLVQLTPKI